MLKAICLRRFDKLQLILYIGMESGRPLPSGVYIARLVAGDFVAGIKMVLLKQRPVPSFGFIVVLRHVLSGVEGLSKDRSIPSAHQANDSAPKNPYIPPAL